jgi:predicted MFS family arabinose efflux permease
VPALRDDLGLSYAEAGAVLAGLSAGGLIGHGFIVATDFLDRRVIATLGALGYGLCMAAFALGASFPVLLTASILWGASSDAFVHGCEVALVDLAGDDLAPALARTNLYGAIGDLLGPLTLAGAAALGLSWRSPFLAGAALMLLYALWLSVQRFPAPHPGEHARTPLASVLSVVRDRRVIVLALVEGLFGLLDEPLLGFVIAYLERVRGLTEAGATTVAAVVVGGGIAGYASVGLATRRVREWTLLLGAGVAVGLSLGLLVFAPAIPLQAGAGFTFGVAGAVFYSVLQATYLSL